MFLARQLRHRLGHKYNRPCQGRGGHVLQVPEYGLPEGHEEGSFPGYPSLHRRLQQRVDRPGERCPFGNKLHEPGIRGPGTVY